MGKTGEHYATARSHTLTSAATGIVSSGLKTSEREKQPAEGLIADRHLTDDGRECVLAWRKPKGHWDLTCSVTDVDHGHTLGHGPDRPPHDEGDSWGPWIYSRRLNTLTYRGPANGLDYEYEIDLDRARTSAGVMDWVAHLQEKPWLSDEAVGQLVRAMDDIVGIRGGDNNQ